MYDTHAAKELISLFWCPAVMSLQFTHVRSFAGRGHVAKLSRELFYCTVRLYCVTKTWQQIFKGSLQVTVMCVLLHVTVQRRHLGR